MPAVGEVLYVAEVDGTEIIRFTSAPGLPAAAVDNTPVNGATTVAISSDWAYGIENEAKTINGTWTFTGASYAFNNVAVQLQLDSSAQKGIYCNDGAGNFIIRSGNRSYSSDERHPVAGDGAVKEVFSSDAQPGAWLVQVNSGGVAALADDPVVWGNAIRLDALGFFYGTVSGVEANRFVYQGLNANFTGTCKFQNTTTIDRVGLAAQAEVVLDTDAGHAAIGLARTGGLNRWKWGKDNTAESGSNAGADFSIQRHTDAGSYVDTPFHINRATGKVTISEDLTVNGFATFYENPTLDKVGVTEDATWQAAADAGQFAGVRVQTGSVLRWLFGKNYQAESGSDVGSNFQIRRYNDAGTYQDSPLLIQRSDGKITLSGVVDLSRQNAQIRFTNTHAALDEKRWRIIAGSTALDFRIYSDDELTWGYALQIHRSGSAATLFQSHIPFSCLSNIITTGGYLQVNRAGDAADANVQIDRDAGKRGLIIYRTGASQRWQLECNSTAESGSDAGSDFVINRFTDAGVFIESALRIWRDTGNVHIYKDLYPEANVHMNGGYLRVSRVGDAANSAFYIDRDAGYRALLCFRTGSSLRWIVEATSEAEAGSNVGSDFHISRYSDAGALIDTVLKIDREDGEVKIYNTLSPLADVLMTGGFLHINRTGGTAAAHFYMSSDAGYNRKIHFRTGSSTRWQLYANSNAESGSDNGTDFVLARYNDSSVFQGNAIYVDRKTGDIDLESCVQVGKTLHNDNTNDEGNSGTAITVDWTAKNFARFQATNNCTVTFTNPPGPAFLHLRIQQNGSGGHSVSFPSNVRGTITIGTEVNQITLIMLAYTGSEYHVVSPAVTYP